MPLGGHMQKDREKPLERDQEGQNHEVPDRVTRGEGESESPKASENRGLRAEATREGGECEEEAIKCQSRSHPTPHKSVLRRPHLALPEPALHLSAGTALHHHTWHLGSQTHPIYSALMVRAEHPCGSRRGWESPQRQVRDS